MRRVSKTRRARAKRQTERYADSHGIPFAEYRFHLPAKVSDWPAVVRVDDPDAIRAFSRSTCWACERSLNNAIVGVTWGPATPTVVFGCCDIHHLVGGTRGRSDEVANLMPLCRTCHELANTAALSFGRLLAIKWRRDRIHTDWVRLALLKRSFLPALILDNGEVVDG